MEGGFDPDDLRVLDWQYTVIHMDTSAFEVGEVVFLKSNPEFPMTVLEIGALMVYTTWFNTEGERQACAFIPQVLLQYRLACYVTGKRKFNLCLN